MSVVNLLRLANTVLEAAIVILIASVLLYGIRSSIRSRVARASSLLLGFTVIVYLGDLLLTQIDSAVEMERWLRMEWVGIALVPSAYLHLSDALLELNADRSPWRRLTVSLAYGLGGLALALSTLTDLIVQGKVVDLAAPQLRAGPLFPVVGILFGGCVALGATYQIRARRRIRTATMKRRITYLMASAGGPVISVFPYLLITGQSTIVPSFLFWAIQIAGNSVVSMTIFFMTYSAAYFGVNEPDRVVRLRLIKFLARGPLVAIGVLVSMVVVERAGRFLGIPSETAIPFVVVGGIVIFQWIILLIKPALERWFYFDERDQVVRLQELRDRVVTTRDLHQFLENVLASVCELLQVESAFVASFAADGQPQVELIVGEPYPLNGDLRVANWQSLQLDPASSLPAHGERFVWNGYWIISLYDQAHETVLGILGVHAPPGKAGVTPELDERLNHFAQQAAAILEDQLLQQSVFEAMEGLLQQVETAQQQVTGRDGAHPPAGTDEGPEVSDRFTKIVRDALSHYWGGPKLTQSPLLDLQVVKQETREHRGNTINAMRAVLLEAIESLRPEGNRSMTTREWILYNILELKFLRRYKVRDVARRLAMSESDLYRKQRIAIRAVGRALAAREQEAKEERERPRPSDSGRDE